MPSLTRHLIVLTVLAAIAQSCGGSTAPASPSPPTGTVPLPTGPFANVSGRWSGTIESDNAATRTVSLNAVQITNCVDGTWVSTAGDWTGAISGFADAVSYAGQMSIEFSVGGQRCTGVADISGPVDADTIRWTGSGFRVIGQCATALPQSIVVTLRRM